MSLLFDKKTLKQVETDMKLSFLAQQNRILQKSTQDRLVDYTDLMLQRQFEQPVLAGGDVMQA